MLYFLMSIYIQCFDMKKIIYTLVFSLFSMPLIVSAQTLMGGVGDATTNAIWFDALDLGQTDGTSVTTWTSTGSDKLTATTSGSNKPTYRNNTGQGMNGYPVIDFDGVDDQLILPSSVYVNLTPSFYHRTYAMVFRTSSNIVPRQMIYEEGGSTRGFNIYIENGRLFVGAYNEPNDGTGAAWNYTNTSVSILPNTAYVFVAEYDGNATASGSIRVFLNGAQVATVPNVGRLYSHVNAAGFGSIISQTHYPSIGVVPGDQDYFQGDLAEFGILSKTVNTTERMIIENYLSARYNIALATNDLFDQDNAGGGQFDHYVTGIGRNATGTQHMSAQGPSPLRISNPRDVQNGEFMLWGDNGITCNCIATNDLPPTIDQRIQRTWRVSEIGDIGAVDLSIDLSGYNSISTLDMYMLIDTDNDGSFANETLAGGGIVPANGQTGFTYTFSNVADLAQNTRFTFAASDYLLRAELIEFEVRPAKQPQTALLYWSTAEEENMAHYHIERSLDDLSWTRIGTVQAVGDSRSMQQYQFLDEAPSMGHNYYRLVMEERSGLVEYSAVRVLSFEERQTFTLFPNPAQNEAQIRFNQWIEKGEVQLFDMTGRPIAQYTIQQTQIFTFPVQHLAAGSYVIQVRTDNQTARRILIIQ